MEVSPSYGWTYIPSLLPLTGLTAGVGVYPCTLLWVDLRSQLAAPDRAYWYGVESILVPYYVWTYVPS